MRYSSALPATFLSRPNRFVAQVLLDGRETTVHVKNTGRCRELLVPGAAVWLEKSKNPARKTLYDLITVQKGTRLINMDSAAPNAIFREWAQTSGHFGKPLLIKPEQRFGDSRLDFYLETASRRIFVEVKGCTLEENGVCRFPDAPTERGVKHLKELIRCKEAGYDACIAIIIQMEQADHFEPNDKTHPAFGRALREANAAGVEILALSCRVSPMEIAARGFVPVVL